MSRREAKPFMFLLQVWSVHSVVRQTRSHCLVPTTKQSSSPTLSTDRTTRAVRRTPAVPHTPSTARSLWRKTMTWTGRYWSCHVTTRRHAATSSRARPSPMTSARRWTASHISTSTTHARLVSGNMYNRAHFMIIADLTPEGSTIYSTHV